MQDLFYLYWKTDRINNIMRFHFSFFILVMLVNLGFRSYHASRYYL